MLDVVSNWDIFKWYGGEKEELDTKGPYKHMQALESAVSSTGLRMC